MVREDTILSQFIRSKTSFQTNLDCVQNFPPKMWSGEGMEGKGGKRREGMEGKGREEKGVEGREEKGGEGREEKRGEGREGGVYIMVTPIMPVGFWCNMISQIFLTKT